MSTIQFKEANCKNCYKCIRNCPVKAISFKNEQAQIMEKNCILCGRCLQVCPQNAKNVVNDVDRVKYLIEKNEKVYASIAPSFASAFNIDDAGKMFSALKRLGFSYVEETAVGAAQVSLEYEKLIEQNKMKNIITTACPVVVSLVEKYYPDLLCYLAPVVSPMIAHAKMMKKMYGPGVKIVFIGPCLAKKEEYKDCQNDNVIDAVITFEELEKWLDIENISLSEQDSGGIPDFKKFTARYYPIPGGILKTLSSKDRSSYKFIGIDGTEKCMETLESLRGSDISGYFIEMNSCSGGCINGPCISNSRKSFIEYRDRLTRYIKKARGNGEPHILRQDVKVNLSKEFFDKSKPYNIPDEETIRKILRKIGKFKKEDELNCGACGYPSCRDKAIAVYNNKADLHMCLPYMRERAESISNIIINSTPNAIIALNQELCIQEINTTARKMFKLEKYDLIGKNIYNILDCPDFQTVKDTEENIFDKKYHYDRFEITVDQSIIYSKEHEAIIIIMKDITKEENQKEQIYKMRCETVDIAQKVIEKQMRVAQEIASLLGETTAETKVALTKLKKSMLSGTEED
ncbi:MAG TPA: histidine kinase [Clostridiaceae bacterium]|nr:histidine kinase [Clostridiaceae bacterium]